MSALILPRATRKVRPALLAGLLLVVMGTALLGQGVYIRAKAMLAQVLLERAWAETLATGKPVKAWSWADTHPEIGRAHV